MQEAIKSALAQAVKTLQTQGILPADLVLKSIPLERTRSRDHGEFASPLALQLAKQVGKAPRGLAEKLQQYMVLPAGVAKIELAGPGFINIFLQDSAKVSVIKQVLADKAQYGCSDFGNSQRVLLEYVSANPTGPLHVGHGRGAAMGASLANIMQAAGFNVTQEYYINDAGRQMDILFASVWCRWYQLIDKSLPFPARGYQGDYVYAMAERLHADKVDLALVDIASVLVALNSDAEQEDIIDALILALKSGLSADRVEYLQSFVLATMMGSLQQDLAAFGVHFDTWFNESQCFKTKALDAVEQNLSERGHTYTKENAIWLRTSDFGDEKDRVLRRGNGQPTYFLPDIAYHQDKYARGFDKVLNIWGSDHHGYIPRMRAALQALGHDTDKFEVLLVQFANLFRGKTKVSMSTRSGEYVTLASLIEEIGIDAARFFYVMRRSDQHLDFDLELAKEQSSDNPVYYIQYAHARVCSVFSKAQQQGLAWDISQADWESLTREDEAQLMDDLACYPEWIVSAASNREPHRLALGLQRLAHHFHAYYNGSTFLVDNVGLRNARLGLCRAVQQVIANGLGLLGVTAPDKM